MHEAYRPIIDDGRGRFPEDLRVKAPRGARAAIAAAAQLRHDPSWCSRNRGMSAGVRADDRSSMRSRHFSRATTTSSCSLHHSARSQ